MNCVFEGNKSPFEVENTQVYKYKTHRAALSVGGMTVPVRTFAAKFKKQSQ